MTVGLTGVAGGDGIFSLHTRTGVRFPPAPRREVSNETNKNQ